ncbi:unnamed protein product [Ectocarpus sp. 13 AM-2016]
MKKKEAFLGWLFCRFFLVVRGVISRSNCSNQTPHKPKLIHPKSGSTEIQSNAKQYSLVHITEDGWAPVSPRTPKNRVFRGRRPPPVSTVAHHFLTMITGWCTPLNVLLELIIADNDGGRPTPRAVFVSCMTCAASLWGRQ